MSKLTKLRPSPALVVALAALVAATSGAALALPGKNSVTKNDIKNGAVTTKKIARGAVGSQQIKGKSIRGNRLKDKAIKAKQLDDKAVTTAKIDDNAITSAQVADNGLNTSDLSDVKVFGTQPVAATDGVDAAAARAAAPKQELFKKGQLTVYGKCYRDVGLDEVHADVFIETSANGAVFTASDNGVLNTDTAEQDRHLSLTTASNDAATMFDRTFVAIAPDGTKLTGDVAGAAKNGTPAGGDGVFGAGDKCLFTGSAIG